MGSVFEELIRKFAELSNETAGEHFTPRDVIRLMADLLFIEDDDALYQARRRSHAFMIRRRRRQHRLGEINTFAFALELQQRVQPLVEQESLFERQFP